MPQKRQEAKQCKATPTGALAKELPQLVVVGTYKEKQLAWMKRHGVYNYPVRAGDKFDDAALKQVCEVWLYADAQGTRHAFRATFEATMSAEAFRARHPSYAKLGPSRHQAYYVFKVESLDYGSALEMPEVIVRMADFGRRTAKIKQAIAQFEADGSFAPLALYLPSDLATVPSNHLRVCEEAMQMTLFAWNDLQPIRMPKPRGFTAVELFAGAGGLSIGLERAGIHIVIANEIMPDFAATLAANHPDTNVINEDIHKINFREELKKLGLESVDVLSGGPPCQGFSTIGAKNRQDPRNSLFYEYLRAVAETHPKYTIFENVSGFKRMYGGFAYETLIRELDELGYETKCQILNAADYGVPQVRYRTVVLGWKKGLPALDFPVPTNGVKKGLRPYLTLMDAISDLPKIGTGESSNQYATPPQNEYQRKIRGGQTELLEHNVANYGEKMQEILRTIPAGGSVSDLPMRLRPKSAYCNTYARLLPNEPSPTITRNFGTPSSSRCVHPYQPRALSTREGARLQGFPDSYRFVGGKQSKNLQIGNAVPPILGEAIANVVVSALQKGGGER